MNIREFAQHTGLTAHTLRYYERIGLIAPVARARGGQRSYAAQDLDWIDFLLRLRATGMPIGGMQAFARLRSEGDATAGERRALLEAHLAWLLDTMAALRLSADVLQAKIAHYRAVEQSLSPHPTDPERTLHDDIDHRNGNPPRAARSALPPRPRQAARDRR